MHRPIGGFDLPFGNPIGRLAADPQDDDQKSRRPMKPDCRLIVLQNVLSPRVASSHIIRLKTALIHAAKHYEIEADRFRNVSSILSR
jgi:hypothetical protein